MQNSESLTYGITLPAGTNGIPVDEQSKQTMSGFQGNKTKTILVADDDPVVLRLTSVMLAKRGYTVLTAIDGMEAVALFEVHRDEICAVVTDLIMPRMNGREAIERIRVRNPVLPIILTSSCSGDMIGRAAMDALGIVFLQKPVIFDHLMEALSAGTA
jgi:CheY-like chemotaxis protein